MIIKAIHSGEAIVKLKDQEIRILMNALEENPHPEREYNYLSCELRILYDILWHGMLTPFSVGQIKTKGYIEE